MRTCANSLGLLLRLAIVAEMILGAFCFPGIAAASGPADIPSVLALQDGNHAPVAAGDAAATTALETEVTIDVLRNDYDLDGDTLTVASVTQPGHGTVTNNGDNVTYIASTGYCGLDSFSYVVSDGVLTDTATVGVVVCVKYDYGVEHRDDVVTIFEDGPPSIIIDVLANDDILGIVESLDLITPPRHGTVTISAPGSGHPKFIYTPDDDYCGPDPFFYTARVLVESPSPDWHDRGGYALVNILEYCPPIPPPDITCGSAPALSTIGQAVDDAIGQDDTDFSQRTWCNNFEVDWDGNGTIEADERDWILDVPEVTDADINEGGDLMIPDETERFYGLVGEMIRNTRYTFSLSTLRFKESRDRKLLEDYLAPAILYLHDHPPEGGQYPLLRFAYSEEGGDAETEDDVYNALVSKMVDEAENPIPPEDWKVSIAVGNVGRIAKVWLPDLGTPWNHSKIAVRDYEQAIVGGMNWSDEYPHLEFDGTMHPLYDLSMRVEGEAARAANIYFDRLWKRTFDPDSADSAVTCVTSWKRPGADPGEASDCQLNYVRDYTPGYTPDRHIPDLISSSQITNVFALGRGHTTFHGGPLDQSADYAVLAAFGAAEQTIYVSQHMLDHGQVELEGEGGGVAATTYSDEVIGALVQAIVTNTVHVKLILSDKWVGETSGVGTGSSHEDVYDYIEDKIYVAAQEEYGARTFEVDRALCRLEFGPFRAGTATEPLEDDEHRTHNKFFMVDGKAFYVGSQNLYPSAIGTTGLGEKIGQLNEFGFLVDDEGLADQMKEQFWDPVWTRVVTVSQRLYQPEHLSPGLACIDGEPVGIVLSTEPCSVLEYYPWGFDKGVACGVEMICKALVNAGVYEQHEYDACLADPPVPGMLFATTPFPTLPPGGAQSVVTATATHATAPIAASLTTSHTVFGGNLDATWATDAWAEAQFTSLSVPWAQVYDEHNTLLAAGAVQASPVVGEGSPPSQGGAGGGSAIAIALGDLLTYTIAGTGFAATYAPAVEGLGVGGHWLTYTAQVESADPAAAYDVRLLNAAVTVDGSLLAGSTPPSQGGAGGGSLTLVTSDTVRLAGRGRTLVPNFAERVAIQATDADVQISDPATQRISLSGYSGPITITEHTTDLDLVELDGPAARDLSLETVPASSSIAPVETASFQTEIRSNADDVYEVTVVPPLGWQAQVDATGLVTITPALDAEPGAYQVHLVAQSTSPPSQGGAGGASIWATAVHEVTILPWQGMELSVAPDPFTTVPMGPASPPQAGGTGGGASINNGQTQVPGAAFIATITNTSSAAHTFDVEVVPDGFSAEWIVLGGAGRSPTTTVRLSAGSSGNLGVYVSPLDLDVLNEVAIPTQARAFILDTVLRGYAVLVPERMVEWHGEQAIAWWQLDLETGEMVGVGEDGTHCFLIVFAVSMISFFVPMILLLLGLMTILLRLLVWRLAAEETWRYFWREAREGVAGAEGEGRLQEAYQEALNRTKAHMQGLRWWLPAWLW
jgi:phosphatidylserine/phosphatidylglycerophosphate/cardiolipin synthase-like enzyme